MSNSDDEELTRKLRNRDVPFVENQLVAELTKTHRKRTDKNQDQPKQESKLEEAERLKRQDIESGVNPFASKNRLVSPVRNQSNLSENLSDSLASEQIDLFEEENHSLHQQSLLSSTQIDTNPIIFIDEEFKNFPDHLNLVHDKNIFSDLELTNPEIQKFIKTEKNSNQIKMPETFDYTLFHRMIPEYNGNKDDLNHFVACCDQFFKNYTEDENKKKFMQALVRKLTDRAFEFYNKQDNNVPWETFREEFRKYFASQQSFEGYQIELAKIKQNSQTVRKYGERIEKILNEINKLCSEIKVSGTDGSKYFKVQNERLAIKSFINGLNDPYKNIMRSRKFDTIGRAISDAIELETDEKINNLNNLQISETKLPDRNPDNVQENQRWNSNDNNSRRKVVCFKCGTPNHTANQCLINPSKNRFNNPFRNNFDRFQKSHNFYNNQIPRQRANSFPRINERQNNSYNSNRFQINRSNFSRFQPNRPFMNENPNHDISNRIEASSRPNLPPRFNEPNQYNFMQNLQNPQNSQRDASTFNYAQRNTNNPFNTHSANINPANSNQNQANRTPNIQICSEPKNELEQSAQMDNAALDFLIA